MGVYQRLKGYLKELPISKARILFFSSFCKKLIYFLLKERIIKKAREFQKNIYFCFIDYAKPLTVWITINCGKFFKRWEYQTT